MILRKLTVYISLIALIVLVALLSQTAQKYDVKYRVEKIYLVDNKLVPSFEILNFAHLNSPNDLKELTLEQIVDRIEKHPYIKSANCKFIDSITLRVSIEEIVPFAYVFGGTTSYLITTEAKILPFNSNVIIYDIPLITGVRVEKYQASKYLINEEISYAYRILSIIKRIDIALFSSVSEIEISKTVGAYGYLSRPHARIIFGENFDDKKGIHFSEFWRQIILNKNLVRYEYIDLRFENQLVAKEKSLNQFIDTL